MDQCEQWHFEIQSGDRGVYQLQFSEWNQVYEFTPHSGLLLPNGGICFSGNNGFVTFSPQELQLNSFVPPLVFTKLVVNNQVIEPEDETGILDTVLDGMEEIELSYNQNNISIGYCALNFVFAWQNQYATFLKGYDKDWNYIGNRRKPTIRT